MTDPTQRVRASFDQQQAMRLIGAELVSVTAGEVEIALSYRPELTQQQGFVHAGVITTLLDSACGYAALTAMPEGSEVVSVEFKVNLLAPSVGERFRAVGKVRRAGKTLVVCTGEAFALKDGQEKLVSLMQATMFTVGA
ncbi:MAG: PaaI family thioesterase [Myxococcota bacterium]|nr:PaaI family thioesterase [Myxococcota bacterium]